MIFMILLYVICVFIKIFHNLQNDYRYDFIKLARQQHYFYQNDNFTLNYLLIKYM